MFFSEVYGTELLLKWENGEQKANILRFLVKSLPISKVDKFSECNERIFNLIQALTKENAWVLKPYSKDIVKICLNYITSSRSTANEKESATKTIFELVTKDAISTDFEMCTLSPELFSVFKKKSSPVRTQQKIFELLGIVSKKFPSSFSTVVAKELREKLIHTILTLFKDDKASVSMSLIAGAVEGLKNHLVNFTPKPEEDPEFSKQLYECMLNLSKPFPTTTNRVPFRKMLEIIRNFSHLHDIPKLMFQDFLQWQNTFITWISSKSHEDKTAGANSMQEFHKLIAKVINERNDEEDKKILHFFMKYFRDTLESPKSQPHEIQIAICGFGSMAGACKLLLEPKYLSDLFDLVMQRTEYSYLTKDRLKRREVLEHLPNYVKSLSKIMCRLDEISGIQLHSLQSIVVVLIKDFHFLSTSHHSLVAFSLLETFVNLLKMGMQN